MGQQSEQDQVYHEYEREQGSVTKKVIHGLSPKQFLIFVFMILVLIVLYIKKIFVQNTLLLLGGGVVVVFFFMINKGDEEDDFVDIRKARAIIENELEYLQKHHVIPEGKIFYSPIFQTQHFEGVPNKHVIKFDIVPLNGAMMTFAVEVKAKGKYAGKIVGLKEYAEGITGREAQDIVYLETMEQKFRRKYGWDKNKPDRA